MTAPRLHILLPVHNRCATTLRCVEALRGQTWGRAHLVLVDDGSTDGTAGAVRKLWPEVEVLTGAGKWWWAGALQQGCLHLARTGAAEGDVVLLLNDDVTLAPEFLARAMTEFGERPGTLLLARQVDARTGAELDHGGGVQADLRELRFVPAARPEDINCLPTRGLFLRWGDLRRLGGFRPDWLPHYLSDYEFTLRAHAAGCELRVASSACLGVALEQSGRSLANLDTERWSRRLALLFSPRFKDNPLAWSAFVSLAVAPARRPYLWLKVWVHFALVVVPRALRP